MRRMIGAAFALMAVEVCAAVPPAEDSILALPGQAEGSAVDGGESAVPAEKTLSLDGRPTHASLRHPFIELYYLEPTVTAGEAAKVSYYVTDFDHRKVRFGDNSARFDVTLGWSADGANWTEKVQKGVRTGDGAFLIEGLPRGDYTIRLSCVDDKGVESRTVWSNFRVRSAGELTIGEDETVRPTVEDLVKAGIISEAEGFYSFFPVELADGIEFPVGIWEDLGWRQAANAAKKATNFAAISNAVAAAIASPAGRKALSRAGSDGYVVFAPTRNGAFIYRSRLWRRIVPGEAFDEVALERRAATNSVMLTKYLAEQVAAGKRKVVLPKAVWRVSAAERLFLPSRLTLDLNGGKIKLNGTRIVRARPVDLYRTEDAHLVNGRVEGNYFEYDYEHSEAKNPEHITMLNISGDSRYCSFENLDISCCTGSGTTFGLCWLERPEDVISGKTPRGGVVEEWKRHGNPIVYFTARPAIGRGKKQVPAEHWERGLLDARGAVKDGGEGCYTSPVRALGGLTNKTYLAVSLFLGYRGMSGVSDYFTIAFYGMDGRFLHREIAFQHCRIRIPAGAVTMRISLEAESQEKADKCKLGAFFFYQPEHCVWRNVRYRYCRTNGLSIGDGFNMLFEDIDIARSGDESCRCASDAENGCEGMQNMTFRRITCHDNPNGDFTVCCGLFFVYENCSMRWWLWHRVHSPLLRNCTVKKAQIDRLTRTAGGYARFENNAYDCREIRLGTPERIVKRKKSTPDWEIVLDGGVFRGESKEAPTKVEACLTGRFRNCTFENCQLVGPEERFTDCKIGAGCTRVAK